jgi:hypothetical protein
VRCMRCWISALWSRPPQTWAWSTSGGSALSTTPTWRHSVPTVSNWQHCRLTFALGFRYWRGFYTSVLASVCTVQYFTYCILKKIILINILKKP